MSNRRDDPETSYPIPTRQPKQLITTLPSKKKHGKGEVSLGSTSSPKVQSEANANLQQGGSGEQGGLVKDDEFMLEDSERSPNSTVAEREAIIHYSGPSGPLQTDDRESEVVKSTEGNGIIPDVIPPTKKRRRAAAGNIERKDDASSEGGGTASEGRGSKHSRSRKAESAIQQFMTDVLPSLRKEMKQNTKKKVDFNLSEYADYFSPKSNVKPTYLLPLFYFLQRKEIVCNRYGYFQNQHKVKTADGCSHALLLSQCGDLTDEESNYIMRRFGKEWHKIPAKDANMCKNAHRLGHLGQFKIILTGVYEDSFVSAEGGETINTLNPVLSYEVIREPTPKKSSSSSSSICSTCTWEGVVGEGGQ